jgi:hypothetical protein
MDFGRTHRILRRVEIGPLLGALNGADEKDWDADEDLRKKLAPYRQTRSIFLYFTALPELPLDRPPTQDRVERRAGWQTFNPFVQRIVDDILRDYPPGGVVVRCQLAMLVPGGAILPHTDTSPLLRLSHRIHVPLITYPEVRFLIDGIDHKFEPGVAFELNNQRLHSVENPTALPRTHLIFDYLPPEGHAQAIAILKRASGGNNP